MWDTYTTDDTKFFLQYSTYSTYLLTYNVRYLHF